MHTSRETCGIHDARERRNSSSLSTAEFLQSLSPIITVKSLSLFVLHNLRAQAIQITFLSSQFGPRMLLYSSDLCIERFKSLLSTVQEKQKMMWAGRKTFRQKYGLFHRCAKFEFGVGLESRALQVSGDACISPTHLFLLKLKTTPLLPWAY